MTRERDIWMKCELRTLERERVGSACSYMSFFNCTTSQFFSMLCGTEYVRRENSDWKLLGKFLISYLFPF